MSDIELTRLETLIKKKKSGIISTNEQYELIHILHRIRKNSNIAPGIQVAAGILLASILGRQISMELHT